MKKDAVEKIPRVLRVVRQNRAQERRWELVNDTFTNLDANAAFEMSARVTAH